MQIFGYTRSQDFKRPQNRTQNVSPTNSEKHPQNYYQNDFENNLKDHIIEICIRALNSNNSTTPIHDDQFFDFGNNMKYTFNYTHKVYVDVLVQIISINDLSIEAETLDSSISIQMVSRLPTVGSRAEKNISSKPAY